MKREKTSNSTAEKTFFFFCKIGAVMLCVFVLGCFFYGMHLCFNFSEIYDNAVTVKAVVVEHKEKESDDLGSSYHSYISYTYEGKNYEKKEYEVVTSKKDLTNIGETVFVKINPENPGDLLNDLAWSARFGVLFCGLTLFIALTCWIDNTLRERITKQPIETVDEQIAEMYIKQKIKSNGKRNVSFVIMLWLFTISLVFSLLFIDFLPEAACSAAIFFFFLAKDIYTWVNVKKNGFKICKGKYSNKTIETSDGTEYCLKYFFDDLSCEQSFYTTYDNYMNVLETDTAYLVYCNHKPKSPAINFYSVGNKMFVDWDC